MEISELPALSCICYNRYYSEKETPMTNPETVETPATTNPETIETLMTNQEIIEILKEWNQLTFRDDVLDYELDNTMSKEEYAESKEAAESCFQARDILIKEIESRLK